MANDQPAANAMAQRGEGGWDESFAITSDDQEANAMKIGVIGAGVSGCCAALQAARSGAACLLVEKNGMPGGTLSMGGVAVPGLFHAWGGRQIIAGIGWELVQETVALAGGQLPDFTKFDMIHHWLTQVPVNPVLFSALCDQKFQEAGVDVRYHTMLGKVEKMPAGMGAYPLRKRWPLFRNR